MPRRALLILALALLTPALTGCLGMGQGEDADDGLSTQSQAQTSQDTGGIEGIVTDSAVQPVTGASVTLEGASTSTQTAEDGSFAFSNVLPGTYTLNITADGFIATTKTVDVQQNKVSTVEVILAHVPEITPFSQVFEFKGFLECSAAIPNAMTPPSPYGAVAVCGAPNTLLGGNATNDRFMFTHKVEANPWQMVTEMSWEAGNPTSERLSLVTEAEGFPNNGSATFGDGVGASPVVISADRERIAGVVNNLTEACENGDDGACNRNYIENGGPAQIRVFVDGTETQPGTAIQQDYTLVNTIFYNAPACEDYSVFEENTCAQADLAPDEDPYEEG